MDDIKTIIPDGWHAVILILSGVFIAVQTVLAVGIIAAICE